MNETAVRTMGRPLGGEGSGFSMNLDLVNLVKPHRPPMVLVDGITDCNLSKQEVTGYRVVSFEDPYVVAHFPDEPTMPGSFVVEAMAQTAGCLMNFLHLKDRGLRMEEITPEEFLQIELPPYTVLAEAKIKHFGMAAVGETIRLYANILVRHKEVVAFKVEATVGELMIASGELILAYPPYSPVGKPQPPDAPQHNNADR